MKPFLFFILIASTFNSVCAKIEDNSFLLEEAYNQEPGVHQFIQAWQNFQQADESQYYFEHEFALGSAPHQGSYYIPYDTRKGELGDIFLSYRFQPYKSEKVLHAQRFSLIAPTGDVEDGSGKGVWGAEFVHATTVNFNDKWAGHLNAGFNHYPKAKSEEGTRRTLFSPMAGLSAIYLLSENFNLLLETLFTGEQDINENGELRTENQLTISPGFRVDVFPSWEKTQVVSGVAFPVEVMNSPNEHGVLFYLSIEPDFN